MNPMKANALRALFDAFDAGNDCFVDVLEGLDDVLIAWGADGGPYFASTAQEAREIAAKLRSLESYLELAKALEDAAAIAEPPSTVRH